VDDDAKCTFSKSNPLDDIIHLYHSQSISLICLCLKLYIYMAKDNKEQKKIQNVVRIIYTRLHIKTYNISIKTCIQLNLLKFNKSNTHPWLTPKN
jgi:hypothetical protein